MAERKDPALWGPEFSERMHACQAIATARHRMEMGVKDELPQMVEEGKALILKQLGLAQSHPQLEGPWIEAALFAFSRLPPVDDGEWDVKNMAESRATDLKSTEALALDQLEGIRKDTRMVASLIDGSMGILVSPREKGGGEKALEAEIAELEGRLEWLRRECADAGPAGGGCENTGGWDDVARELDLEITSETAKTLELTIAGMRKELGELAAGAEAEWKERLAEEESLLDGYKEQLAEQAGEAAAYASHRSAAVRRKAAEVLVDARDVRSLVNSCYLEMDPGVRMAAFGKAVEAVRMGPGEVPLNMNMVPRRGELNMLLRMVEDTEPGIAARAWELAEWLLDGAKLDAEQLDFLEMHAKNAKGNLVAARVLSKRAKTWISEACGGESGARVSALAKVLDGMRSGLELDGEQKELVVEFTGEPDADVSAQAFKVALELCREKALAPEQVATLVRNARRIDGCEKRGDTMARLFDLTLGSKFEDVSAEWLLAIAVAGRNDDEKRTDSGIGIALRIIAGRGASPEQVEEFVSLVDSAESGPLMKNKERILASVRQVVKPEDLTGKAADILDANAGRFSQMFLDTVPDGRASGVSLRPEDLGRRRSRTPEGSRPPEAKVCGPDSAQKAPVKG